MPSNNVAAPASSAPVDRLTMAVAWVRPSAQGINGAAQPSYSIKSVINGGFCFEGSEE
ncbi:unannotated protein [freshwater metagenome]|uniref:Unannotated protein n=1 Tax=freshwater metagenome TaxID=449393 RepID=A0A6J7QKK2_9ZZZZ|nr:hypothetical protein [Actinomycetota bacterium]